MDDWTEEVEAAFDADLDALIEKYGITMAVLVFTRGEDLMSRGVSTTPWDAAVANLLFDGIQQMAHDNKETLNNARKRAHDEFIASGN